MNRDTLVAKVAEATGNARRDVEQIILATLEHITRTLRRGEEVSLVGFGQFTVNLRSPRRGVSPRNPQQAIHIPAVNVVKFQAGKNLKEAVRGETRQ